MQGVFDAGLLFLEFGFAGGADIHLRHAAGQLGQAFLQFFAVVVAGAGGDFGADLGDAVLDVLGGAGAFDDGGVVAIDHQFLDHAQLAEFHLVELDAEILHDGGAAGQDGDVFEHGLAAVAVAGGLDGHHLQDAAQLVHDQGGQGFALDILGDDEQRLLGGDHLFQQRHEFLDRGDFVLMDQHQALLQLNGHLVGVGDEVGRQEAAVELHAFDHIHVGFQRLAFFHGDDAVFADLFHGIGHDLADFRVVVGGDGGDRFNVLAALDLHGAGVDVLDRFRHGLLDAAHQGVGIGAGDHMAQAFLEDGFGQHGGGGGAVAGLVAGLAGGFLHELGAHVFGLVAQFNFFGDRDAVLGDGRAAPGLVEHGVAAAGAEGGFDGGGEFFNAGKQFGAGVAFEGEFLHGHDGAPRGGGKWWEEPNGIQ